MKSQCRLFTLSVFIVSSLLFFTQTAFAQEANCSIASSALQMASSIRGLRLKKEVPCRIQNKEQVLAYLRDALEKKVPKEKMAGEEHAYKLIGLIPEKFDYVDGLVRLYTDQLGGYYDPDGKFYAMASWMPSAVQMPIAVHELTHALQDQYYDLGKMMDDKTGLTDELMAKQALVEGDATAVMIDYARKMSGQGSIAKEENVSGFVLQNILGAMLSPSLQAAPPALQTLLIFPYLSGLNFTHSLLKHDGYKSVDTAFLKAPQSTEEVLHPDKYTGTTAGFYDFRNKMPADAPPMSGEMIHSDRLGEFIIVTLLGIYIPPEQASTAATGWGGDIIELYKSENSPNGSVRWSTHWDTLKDADEFAQALRSAYAKRFGADPVMDNGIAEFTAGDAKPLRYRIEQRAEFVYVLAGL